MAKRASAGGSGLDTVRSEFEAWRASRPRGTRIPQRLWDLAVELARDQGVSPISQALRLDYYSLQSRLETSTLADSAQPSMLGSFVEIPFSGAADGPACVLEFEDGRGARLRLELEQLGPGELEALVQAVWGLVR
jgi:hypothetical protein